MKRINYIILVIALLATLNCNSCRKKTDNEANSREYITESGFSFETTVKSEVDDMESMSNESITEAYDIKKHPEDWNMNDEKTYFYVLETILSIDKDLKLWDYRDRLPLTDNFKNKYDLGKATSGIVDFISYGDLFERPTMIKATDEEKHDNLIWLYTGGAETPIERRILLKYYISEDGKLDDIEIVEIKIDRDLVAESIENRPKSYNELNRYKEIIPQLFDSKPIDSEYFTDKEANEWRDYIRNYYEGCTEAFFNRYDPLKGIVDDIDAKIYSSHENEELTNLEKKCVGVTVVFVNTINDEEYKKNYMVYFEVDNRNFLDSITKVEEVLEDGTTVEIENNFGK